MSEFVFRKSSHSGGQPDSQCVEVADNVATTVAVRDSKEPAGPCIRLSPTAWAAFLSTLRGGEERAA
ncbi:DUF397 domain-containing protein [Streptomyces verrucosisporus]|uniref:DUF397 domain-containing protein n=1 Tax=Streptomyces verrucosisporus TaxID=1695161 RepID=UPI0019D22151|nr:DUF397 domain-containing protein [Streptomyces verrucosisporus]MBN3931159.1 DUF397 domain-containing protein [Streptomyces verrucosisporus]